MLLTCTVFESPSSIIVFRTYPYASNLKPRLCRLTRAAALAYNVLRALVAVCLLPACVFTWRTGLPHSDRASSSSATSGNVFLLLTCVVFIWGLRIRILAEPALQRASIADFLQCASITGLICTCENCASAFWTSQLFCSVLPSLTFNCALRNCASAFCAAALCLQTERWSLTGEYITMDVYLYTWCKGDAGY